jgi:hypothetical protein
MTVSDSVVIAASADDLYDAISDVAQMGRWSPENLGAVVDEPRQEAYVGMSFVGHNKRGPFQWRTRCDVTTADRGREFAFRVNRYGFVIPPVLPVRVASWAYRFEPVEGGTRVTETWTDDRTRWPDTFADQFDRFATKGKPFREFQLKNIRKTLANLKADFETR